MSRFVAAAVIAVLVATPAAAQMPKPGTPDPTKVEKGTYASEPNHTRVRFSVDHFGFSTYSGDFNKITGKLALDPANPADSTLEVAVATDSVYVPSEKLAGELKSADWLDAAKYPQITFKSTKVEKTGATTAKVTGDLTLHGVTKPVTLDATFYGAGPNPFNKKPSVGFEVTGKIKRSDFGVSKLAPIIGDEVELTISAPFEKQG